MPSLIDYPQQRRLTDMEAIRTVQWMISDYLFEISECVELLDPEIRLRSLQMIKRKVEADTKCGANAKSHITKTLEVIDRLLGQVTTPKGMYMGVLHGFLLSWSEDLKLRGEHRGPRLERTLQRCEFYVEFPYFHGYLTAMTKSIINMINIEIHLTRVRQHRNSPAILMIPRSILSPLSDSELVVVSNPINTLERLRTQLRPFLAV